LLGQNLSIRVQESGTLKRTHGLLRVVAAQKRFDVLDATFRAAALAMQQK
jgi:hypothetical protein